MACLTDTIDLCKKLLIQGTSGAYLAERSGRSGAREFALDRLL